jgi:S1-C subfamily serine protease
MVALSLVMLLGGLVAGALIQRSIEPEAGYAGSSAGISYESLQRSVVRVSGEACRYEKFGTGFFADSGIVVTNAHVIAGVTNPWVELQVGTVFRSASATPVYYDPDQDIAVLRTSLAGDYLLMATRYPDSGSRLLAPGFPRGRGFEVKSASFVGVRQMRVESIYGDPQPPRSYVTVDSSLEPGNSGGPLVDTSGRVVGMATAVSVVQRDMAIAVPYERVKRAVDIARLTYGPVPTGSCYTKDL